jgi:ring-1,2-phenylacetyl-CoA epoxidase subunit PaaE
MASVKIQYEGKTTTITCNEGESILEAGLREGVDLPYSCMSGICTACMAKKVEGTIDMQGAEAIDEEDIKKGKVLTCCSFPTSEQVFVNYDEEEV